MKTAVRDDARSGTHSRSTRWGVRSAIYVTSGLDLGITCVPLARCLPTADTNSPDTAIVIPSGDIKGCAVSFFPLPDSSPHPSSFITTVDSLRFGIEGEFSLAPRDGKGCGGKTKASANRARGEHQNKRRRRGHGCTLTSMQATRILMIRLSGVRICPGNPQQTV
jgi:hypothetical protein